MNVTVYREQSPLQKPMEESLAFLFGAVAYYLLEIVWRGFSHPAMALCGGLCFWFIYRFNRAFPYRSLLSRTLLFALVITVVEFVAGCVLNLQMGQEIWDYSHMPFNLLGQVCPAFSALWFLLSFPACGICALMRRHIFLADA